MSKAIGVCTVRITVGKVSFSGTVKSIEADFSGFDENGLARLSFRRIEVEYANSDASAIISGDCRQCVLQLEQDLYGTSFSGNSANLGENLDASLPAEDHAETPHNSFVEQSGLDAITT